MTADVRMVLFALLLAMPRLCQAQGPATVGVAIPSAWIDSLEVHYSAHVPVGYCLRVEQRADTFAVTGIATPQSASLIVIGGKVRGADISCGPGVPTLRVHPDSACGTNGADCVAVALEERRLPMTHELRAHRLAGSPFTIVQYGPRDYWIYQLQGAVPPVRRPIAPPDSANAPPRVRSE